MRSSSQFSFSLCRTHIFCNIFRVFSTALVAQHKSSTVSTPTTAITPTRPFLNQFHSSHTLTTYFLMDCAFSIFQLALFKVIFTQNFVFIFNILNYVTQMSDHQNKSLSHFLIFPTCVFRRYRTTASTAT